MRSVGMVGDRRRSASVMELRAKTTLDFMNAQAPDLPRALLDNIASQIGSSTPKVGRVVYDITADYPLPLSRGSRVSASSCVCQPSLLQMQSC